MDSFVQSSKFSGKELIWERGSVWLPETLPPWISVCGLMKVSKAGAWLCIDHLYSSRTKKKMHVKCCADCGSRWWLPVSKLCCFHRIFDMVYNSFVPCVHPVKFLQSACYVARSVNTPLHNLPLQFLLVPTRTNTAGCLKNFTFRYPLLNWLCMFWSCGTLCNVFSKPPDCLPHTKAVWLPARVAGLLGVLSLDVQSNSQLPLITTLSWAPLHAAVSNMFICSDSFLW